MQTIQTFPEEMTKKEVVKRLMHLVVATPEAVAEQCRLTRRLGIIGISSSDPELSHWERTPREHLVWQANLFKEVPQDEFESWLGRYLKPGRGFGFSSNMIRNLAQRYRIQKRQRDRALKTISIEGMEMYTADLITVDHLRLGKAVAVITDPPYDKNALHTWSELVHFASRVLVDHGWLIAMSGQIVLPDVFSLMQKAAEENDMRYRWMMALHTPGGKSSQGWIGLRNPLNVQWKPIIVYSKGDATDWPDKLSDFLVSANERIFVPSDEPRHPDEQPIDVFRTLVNSFAGPGQLVVDPFLGGGTTGIAAKQTGRAFEGFDFNSKNVAMAVDNLARNSEDRN